MRLKYSLLKFEEMDATQMPFPDCSFDIVFDKGTYDALAVRFHQCATENSKKGLLTKEMYRVCKPGGYIIVISHNKPEKREKEFMEYVGSEKKISFEVFKLSNLAQLINILRAQYPDKPLSHSLKDKDILANALKEVQRVNVEYSLLKSNKPKEKLAGLLLKAQRQKIYCKPNEQNIRQDHCFMYYWQK